MTKKKSVAKAERKRYSPEFKQQALLRSVKDGIPAAARELRFGACQASCRLSHAAIRFVVVST